ncbi:DUF2806 domain-containing protein [Vibrio parahaemolyticus]
MTKNEISAISLGELSQPVTKLIESVQCAIGTLYEPRKIRKIAKANADASVIEAKARVEVSDIEARALARLNHKEIVRQQNIESIIDMSLDNLPDSVSEELIDEEWLLNFFDSCQNISRSSMQMIWAKILAGEVSEPGSFSIRTLSVLKTLQKNEAELFSNLAQYVWKHESSWVILSPIEKDDDGIGSMGIDVLEFRDFVTLQTCGLVEINIWDGYRIPLCSFSLEYFDEKYNLTMPENKKYFSLSNCNLTAAGRELFEIIYRRKNNIYKEQVLKGWGSEDISAIKVP